MDGTGTAPIPGATIVVQGGRVTAVGPSASVSVPVGSRRIDLTGRTVLPGFVNAHGHVDDDQGRPERVEEQLVLYGRYGVTTVFSLGEATAAGVAFQNSPPRQRARAFVAGPVVEGNTPADAADEVSRVAAMKVAWLKIRVDDNQGAGRKMPREAYRAAIDRAHALGLPVAAHLYYLDDAKQLVRDGIDLLAHSVRDQPVDAELIALLRERNVCVAPTLMREVSVFAYESTPDFFSDPFFLRHANPAAVTTLRDPERQARVRANPNTAKFKEVLALASRNLLALKRAGVRIALGTDSGAANRFQGYFEHMELELMVKAGMSPLEALVAATGDAAACMKQAGSIGTIQPGASADFGVYAANPLVDIRNTKTLQSVWVAGEELR
jgi:imidazolonepropionase-like amidohydrolase